MIAAGPGHAPAPGAAALAQEKTANPPPPRSAARSRPELPGCAPGGRRAARLPRAAPGFIRTLESIKRNVAGGARPPRSLRASSCGDFHCPPRVLLEAPDLTASAPFLPGPPNPAPSFLISENPGLPPAPRWMPTPPHPGRERSSTACHPGPPGPSPRGEERRSGSRRNNNALSGTA